MKHPQEISELPAPPLEIPQVTIQWTIPREWLEFITSRGLSIFPLLEYHVTGAGSKMGNLTVCERFSSSFPRMRLEHEKQVRDALAGETLRVEAFLRLESWRVIKEAAALAGVPPETLIHISAARLINGADQDKAVYAAWRRETSERRAKEKPGPGKVVTGPWETESPRLKKSKITTHS